MTAASGGEPPRRACAPLADKVAFLSRPDAYPERPRRVEAIETHMSWVFLTDRHAYKLKKPVRYDFLDFSTLNARRRDCADEVRLNRRLAPDVYLGTVPLAADAAGRLHLGGGKGRAIVDWLVRMRRLPADRTLERALAAGAAPVDRDRLRALFLRLARFYTGAVPVALAPADYRRRFEDDVRANLRELTRPDYGGLAPQLEAVGRIAAAQRAFLARRGDLLEARARGRRIVEAHGDLRPEHIYLIDPEPVIVDCLEFNRNFRLLDPADELAYLAVECDRLGAPGVGRLAFEVYGEVTGDAPPEPLVAFYRSCRACLRAKIALWHLDEPPVRTPERWLGMAGDYLALAEGYVAGLG